ncbi:unnamed protein product, partial [Adineta ricciae]
SVDGKLNAELKKLDKKDDNDSDEEIERLSQFITSQEPIDDEAAQVIMDELNLVLDYTKDIIDMHVNEDQAEQRREHRLQVYRRAVELAEVNVDDAMELIKHEFIDKNVERGPWLLKMFQYVYLRAQLIAEQKKQY